jgi:hypothetical protein
MEKGWLKPMLEQASADRESWPAWQRGFDKEASRDQTQAAEPDAPREGDPESHEAAA